MNVEPAQLCCNASAVLYRMTRHKHAGGRKAELRLSIACPTATLLLLQLLLCCCCCVVSIYGMEPLSGCQKLAVPSGRDMG